jgi:hypothetical protein
VTAVLDGVVEKVQDGAADGFRVPCHRRERSGGAAGEDHFPPLGPRPDQRDRGTHERLRLDGREVRALAGARRGENALDERLQALALLRDEGAVLPRVAASLREPLAEEAHRRQRRPQLVGDAGEEPLLAHGRARLGHQGTAHGEQADDRCPHRHPQRDAKGTQAGRSP